MSTILITNGTYNDSQRGGLVYGTITYIETPVHSILAYFQVRTKSIWIQN
jgi:hypothetical protein